jgi:SAM-dependent methyltransferase
LTHNDQRLRATSIHPDGERAASVAHGDDGASRDSVRRGRTLVLGAGRKRTPGAVHLDRLASTDPDVVHDLNVHPWPFADGTFNQVIAHDVLEHLNDIVAVFEEIHRICSPGAVVQIVVPHFSCANAFTDPTHRHYFGWFSFDYFTGEHEFAFYTSVRFRTLRRALIFAPTLFNKVAWRVANRWPNYYEHRWAWIFPAWFLSSELEVIKP